MASVPAMTNRERGERQRRIVAAYEAGASSRALAQQFGLRDGWVRQIVKLYGVARPVGRPRRAA